MLGIWPVGQMLCVSSWSCTLRAGLLSRVVDALVDHFLSFKKEQRQLPVVWHQSLLCFVQRWHLLAFVLDSSPISTYPCAGISAPPDLLLHFKSLGRGTRQWGLLQKSYVG